MGDQLHSTKSTCGKTAKSKREKRTNPESGMNDIVDVREALGSKRLVNRKILRDREAMAEESIRAAITLWIGKVRMTLAVHLFSIASRSLPSQHASPSTKKRCSRTLKHREREPLTALTPSIGQF
jgi:hypothetical protein